MGTLYGRRYLPNIYSTFAVTTKSVWWLLESTPAGFAVPLNVDIHHRQDVGRLQRNQVTTE